MTEDVLIGYLHPGTVAHIFMRSMLNLMGSRRLAGVISMESSSAAVAHSRNKLVLALLAGPARWLLMVDSDEGFEPDLVDRLKSVADPNERPIVGGIYPVQITTDEGMRTAPDAWCYDHEGNLHPIVVTGGVVRVDYAGAGCLLVHRGVYEAMADTFPTWFAMEHRGTEFTPEDRVFCRQATKLGYPIYVNTEARLSHRKTVVLTA